MNRKPRSRPVYLDHVSIGITKIKIVLSYGNHKRAKMCITLDRYTPVEEKEETQTLYKALKARFPIYGDSIIKTVKEALHNKVDFKKIRVKNIKNCIEVY